MINLMYTLLFVVPIVGVLTPYSMGRLTITLMDGTGDMRQFDSVVADTVLKWVLGFFVTSLFWLGYASLSHAILGLPTGMPLSDMAVRFTKYNLTSCIFVLLCAAITVLDHVKPVKRRKAKKAEEAKMKRFKDLAQRANKPKVVKKPVKQLYSLGRLGRLIRMIDV